MLSHRKISGKTPGFAAFSDPRNRQKPALPGALLATLRQHIAAIERQTVSFDAQDGTPEETPPAPWCLGLEAVDQALPPTGLARNGLHEMVGATHKDGACAAGFALALMVRRLNSLRPSDKPIILWCEQARETREFGSLHGPGLQAFGLSPESFIFVRGRKDNDVLWAMEEGLHSRAVMAIVGEVTDPSFTATRRLSLACQTNRIPGLLIRSPRNEMASAALTRWRLSSAPSTSPFFDSKAPGSPRWHLELIRCRGGQPGKWIVEWDYETGCFRLAASLADRPAQTGLSSGQVTQWRSTG